MKRSDDKYNPAEKFGGTTDTKLLAAALKFAADLKKKPKTKKDESNVDSNE
jgi:hypothetical protein